MGKSAGLPAATVVWGLHSLVHTIKHLRCKEDPVMKCWFGHFVVSQSPTRTHTVPVRAHEDPSPAVNRLYLDDFLSVSFPDLTRAMVASHSVIFVLWVLFPHNPGFLTFPRLRGNHCVVGHQHSVPPNQSGCPDNGQFWPQGG